MKEIELTKGFFAIVDDSDYEWLNQWTWCAAISWNTVYAVRTEYLGSSSFRSLAMHKQIMSSPRNGKIVDHKNGNGLDNRRKNLRYARRSQNSANTPPRPHSSKYKGVSLIKKSGRWISAISCDCKIYRLGFFDTESEAAKAYDKKARELFGKFAYLNFPRKNRSSQNMGQIESE